MAERFPRLVVDRAKKPDRTYFGAPVECECKSRQWVKVHRFNFRDGRYVQSKAYDLKCAFCGKVRVL